MRCVATKALPRGLGAIPLAFILVVLATLCLAPVARADAAGSARRAVTSEIRYRHGSRTSVSFVDHRVRDLGGDEHEVTGSAFYVTSDSSDRHYFDFSVRVNDRTDSSWSLSIRMRRDDERHDRNRFEFREPRNEGRFSNGRVRFYGYADGDEVRVEVYGREGRRVDSMTMSVRDGRWEGWMTLDRGRYRAVATLVGTDRRINTSFTVGDDDSRIRINNPRRNDEMSGPLVEIYGDADTSHVLVRVLDRDDGPVLQNMVATKNGHWTMTVRLRSGSYHVIAEMVGARGSDDIRFRVR